MREGVDRDEAMSSKVMELNQVGAGMRKISGLLHRVLEISLWPLTPTLSFTGEETENPFSGIHRKWAAEPATV